MDIWTESTVEICLVCVQYRRHNFSYMGEVEMFWYINSGILSVVRAPPRVCELTLDKLHETKKNVAVKTFFLK